MIPEQLEFQIAQYADGTLAESERPALEARLGDDAEARALLNGYRRLDAVLKNSDPLPAVRWEALADHLSRAIDKQPEPATSFLIGRVHRSAWMALAASLLLFVGLMSIHLYRPKQQVATNPAPAPQPAVASAVTVQVTAPQPEPAGGAVVAEVTVQPPAQPGYADAEAVVTAPSRVTIAGVAPVPDGRDQRR